MGVVRVGGTYGIATNTVAKLLQSQRAPASWSNTILAGSGIFTLEDLLTGEIHTLVGEADDLTPLTNEMEVIAWASR